MIVNPTGFGQQTLATQLAMQKANGRRGGRKSAAKRKRANGKKKTARRASSRRVSSSRSRKRTGRKSAHLVKGSPAAKRRMAQLRRMRRK